MKQASDTKTIDLLGDLKRGRGRPLSENAKSDAERARLYRERKKANPVPVIKCDDLIVTENTRLTADIALLNIEKDVLSKELETALDKIKLLERKSKSVNTVTRHEKTIAAEVELSKVRAELKRSASLVIEKDKIIFDLNRKLSKHSVVDAPVTRRKKSSKT